MRSLVHSWSWACGWYMDCLAPKQISRRLEPRVDQVSAWNQVRTVAYEGQWGGPEWIQQTGSKGSHKPLKSSFRGVVVSHPLLRSTFSSSYFEVVSVCFVVLSPFICYLKNKAVYIQKKKKKKANLRPQHPSSCLYCLVPLNPKVGCISHLHVTYSLHTRYEKWKY